MANQLYSYSFPDSYATLVSNYTGTVKYISSTGSNSNNGNSVTTPYLTIDYAITQNSATSRVMFVVLAGTYTMTAVSGTSSSASVAIRDGGASYERVYVCCPGQTVIQWTANTADRDCSMIDFGNTASAIYGATLKRNNNARSGSYVVAYFKGTTKGNLYNCVLQETNANNSWSYQYDNYGYNNLAVRNCTIYNGAAPAGNYSNAGTCLTVDTVFNTTVTTGGTETNVLKSQTVNSSTYVTTGVTTAGVYSGTYAWNGTMTPDTYATVSSTTGSPTVNANVIYSGNSYTTYTFTGSGTMTFSASGAIEYLIVAGGGGGGFDVGGGGGAGGLLYGTTSVTGGSTINLVADATYNSQGWVSGSTDYTGSTRAYSYSAGLQSSSGGARTTALPEVDSYFEVLISATNQNPLCGLARDTSTGGYSNVPCIYLLTGTGYGGLTGGTTLNAFNAGDVLQIAYKASSNQIFIGKNNTWYISPTSGTGATIPGTGSLRFIIMSGASAGSTMSGTFRNPSQNSYSAPSGYSTLGPPTYTVTVGAGGTYAGTNAVASNGSNSVFGALTAIGGGGGGSWSGIAGAAGGSGGGGTSNTTSAAAPTAGQGYAGGAGSGNAGSTNDYSGAAGGGGSDQAGGNGVSSGWSAGSTTAGYGGRGKSDSQLGGILTTGAAGQTVSTVRYIAGGGGASSDTGLYYGVGGYGGGGVGGNSPGTGVVNTGSGGGGGGLPNPGASGGSGIVIVRIKNTTLAPGLYFAANSVSSGNSIVLTASSSNVTTGNLPYTITGVTSAQVSTALTGNISMTSGLGNLTIATLPLLASVYTISVSADGFTANVPLNPNVSISTTIISVGYPANTTYLANPVTGQMNIPDMVVTVAQYDKGGSSKSTYDVPGQMNITSTPVSVTDAVLSSKPLLPAFSNMQANTILSYTTITTSTAGPIQQGIVKLFGDNPNREYWL